MIIKTAPETQFGNNELFYYVQPWSHWSIFISSQSISLGNRVYLIYIFDVVLLLNVIFQCRTGLILLIEFLPNDIYANTYSLQSICFKINIILRKLTSIKHKK